MKFIVLDYHRIKFKLYIYSFMHFCRMCVFRLCTHLLVEWISKKLLPHIFPKTWNCYIYWESDFKFTWLYISLTFFIFYLHSGFGLNAAFPAHISLILLTGSNLSLLIKWSYVLFCSSYSSFHLLALFYYYLYIYWSTLVLRTYGQHLLISSLNTESGT